MFNYIEELRAAHILARLSRANSSLRHLSEAATQIEKKKKI